MNDNITPPPTVETIYELIENLYNELDLYIGFAYSDSKETAHWTNYSRAIKETVEEWVEKFNDLESNPYVAVDCGGNKERFWIELEERVPVMKMPEVAFGFNKTLRQDNSGY